MAEADDFSALLALDGLARRQGAGGLHPRLRLAIRAGGPFPARSSGPAVGLREERPAQVVRFRPREQGERCSA